MSEGNVGFLSDSAGIPEWESVMTADYNFRPLARPPPCGTENRPLTQARKKHQKHEPKTREANMSVFTVKAKPSEGGMNTPTAGAHAAALVAMVDLGTHEATYKNQDGTERKVNVRKVYFGWEINEPMPGGGGNFLIGRDYTLTFSEKSALRKMIEGWSGKVFTADQEFDLTKLMGRPCLINLSHKESPNTGKTYARIESIGPMPKGMTPHTPKRKLLTWDIETGQSADLAELPWLYGEPLVEVIKRSHEYRGHKSGGGNPEADDAGSNDAASDFDNAFPY